MRALLLGVSVKVFFTKAVLTMDQAMKMGI
jgi:hypothetical protein